MADNLRENLEIQYGNAVMPMSFFSTVSAAPSRLADFAEWRFIDPDASTPAALIVGLTTDTNSPQDPADAPLGLAPYTHVIWVVIKLDPKTSCVVQALDGDQPNAHETARRTADQASDRGCL
jgi:hypothetical protein